MFFQTESCPAGLCRSLEWSWSSWVWTSTPFVNPLWLHLWTCCDYVILCQFIASTMVVTCLPEAFYLVLEKCIPEESGAHNQAPSGFRDQPATHPPAHRYPDPISFLLHSQVRPVKKTSPVSSPSLQTPPGFTSSVQDAPISSQSVTAQHSQTKLYRLSNIGHSLILWSKNYKILTEISNKTNTPLLCFYFMLFCYFPL